MNKEELLQKISNLDCINILKHALALMNSEKALDSSSATTSFDLRDKIKRVGLLQGLNIAFDSSSKLVLKTEFVSYEFSNYNNKIKKSYNNNQIPPMQLCIFGNDMDKDSVDCGSNVIIGYITNKKKNEYLDIFVEYKSTNGLNYSIDLLSLESKVKKNAVDSDYMEELPSFFQPKKDYKKNVENE